MQSISLKGSILDAFELAETIQEEPGAHYCGTRQEAKPLLLKKDQSPQGYAEQGCAEPEADANYSHELFHFSLELWRKKYS